MNPQPPKAGETSPVVLTLAELIRRLNAVSMSPRWNRWNVRRFLEAGGVRFIQRAPKTKLYVTLSALRESFPDFWESLLEAEALAADAAAADYGRSRTVRRSA